MFWHAHMRMNSWLSFAKKIKSPLSTLTHVSVSIPFEDPLFPIYLPTLRRSRRCQVHFFIVGPLGKEKKNNYS